MLATIQEYINIKTFSRKGFVPKQSQEVFVIKKVKNTVPWTYFISDVNDEEIVGTFYEKNYIKQNKETEQKM